MFEFELILYGGKTLNVSQPYEIISWMRISIEATGNCSWTDCDSFPNNHGSTENGMCPRWTCPGGEFLGGAGGAGRGYLKTLTG